MRIRGGAPLNPGEVIDARGGLGGGGFGFPLLLGGGGILGVVLLLWLLAGGGGGSSSSATTNAAGTSNLAAQCTTGAAAAQNADCRVVAVVNSVQDYWTSELPREGVQYSDAPTVLYDNAISTGCGFATTAVGPFYCPTDKRVYLDLSFFNDMRTQLGAEGGAFAQAYVIAHEYGHHVQDLLGVRAGRRPDARCDRIECPTRVAGRLLRRRLGASRTGLEHHRGRDAGRHLGRTQCRGRGRRRPDTAGRVGNCEARHLHPRHFRAT